MYEYNQVVKLSGNECNLIVKCYSAIYDSDSTIVQLMKFLTTILRIDLSI